MKRKLSETNIHKFSNIQQNGKEVSITRQTNRRLLAIKQWIFRIQSLRKMQNGTFMPQAIEMWNDERKKWMRQKNEVTNTHRQLDWIEYKRWSLSVIRLLSRHSRCWKTLTNGIHTYSESTERPIRKERRKLLIRGDRHVFHRHRKNITSMHIVSIRTSILQCVWLFFTCDTHSASSIQFHGTFKPFICNPFTSS